MTASIIAPPTLNFLAASLFTRGSSPMALGWQLRRAPILNDEGMGANLPYLWLGLAWCDVALVCCVSPHLGCNSRISIYVSLLVYDLFMS
jgi:hypothetical protein